MKKVAASVMRAGFRNVSGLQARKLKQAGEETRPLVFFTPFGERGWPAVPSARGIRVHANRPRIFHEYSNTKVVHSGIRGFIRGW